MAINKTQANWGPKRKTGTILHTKSTFNSHVWLCVSLFIIDPRKLQNSRSIVLPVFWEQIIKITIMPWPFVPYQDLTAWEKRPPWNGQSRPRPITSTRTCFPRIKVLQTQETESNFKNISAKVLSFTIVQCLPWWENSILTVSSQQEDQKMTPLK